MCGIQVGEGTEGQGLLPDCCALIDFSYPHLAITSELLSVSVGLSEMLEVISKLAPSPNPSSNDIKFLLLASNLIPTSCHHDVLPDTCLKLPPCFEGIPSSLWPPTGSQCTHHSPFPYSLGLFPFLQKPAQCPSILQPLY